MEFDLFTLLPLAAALFVFWKLRSVLGTRNGNERPPYDPYVGDERSDQDDADNVVTLPGAKRRRDDEEVNAAEAAISKIAGKNKDLKQGADGNIVARPCI